MRIEFITIPLFIASMGFAIKSMYHAHQSGRLLNHKSKQTFIQWLIYKDDR